MQQPSALIHPASLPPCSASYVLYVIGSHDLDKNAARAVSQCHIEWVHDESRAGITLAFKQPGQSTPLAAYELVGEIGSSQSLLDAIECISTLELGANGDIMSGEIAAAPPPWALTDAQGQMLLNLCVHSADETATPLVSRGAVLPSCAHALMTTSAHGTAALALRLLVGTRPRAAQCRKLTTLTVPVAPSERGLAQVRLSVSVGPTRLCVCARDVHTGRFVCSVLRASSFCSCDSEEEEEEKTASVRRAMKDGASLPALWRFETPYSETPHPGFCCSGGRFLTIRAPSVHLSSISFSIHLFSVCLFLHPSLLCLSESLFLFCSRSLPLALSRSLSPARPLCLCLPLPLPLALPRVTPPP